MPIMKKMNSLTCISGNISNFQVNLSDEIQRLNPIPTSSWRCIVTVVVEQVSLKTATSRFPLWNHCLICCAELQDSGAYGIYNATTQTNPHGRKLANQSVYKNKGRQKAKIDVNKAGLYLQLKFVGKSNNYLNLYFPDSSIHLVVGIKLLYF